MATDREATYDLFSGQLSETAVKVANMLQVAARLQTEIAILLALSSTRLYQAMRDEEEIPLAGIVTIQTINQEADRLNERMANLAARLDRAFAAAREEAEKHQIPVTFDGTKTNSKTKLQA